MDKQGMKAGTHRKFNTALKSIFAATIGVIFLFVQISPRFYLLSSRPVFHSQNEKAGGQFSGGVWHRAHHAVLSFDKRFAVQKQFFLSTPFFACPSYYYHLLLVVHCPDKITHCALLTQGEELRGPPIT
jgi:hypothetical protein